MTFIFHTHFRLGYLDTVNDPTVGTRLPLYYIRMYNVHVARHRNRRTRFRVVDLGDVFDIHLVHV